MYKAKVKIFFPNSRGEPVEGPTLTFKSVYNVHDGNGLALRVLCVSHCISNYRLKEDLEDTAGLLIHLPRDTLDTATASQPADGGLGDALKVVTIHLAVSNGATLAQTLSSQSTTSSFT
jgi:hypothetical protein